MTKECESSESVVANRKDVQDAYDALSALYQSLHAINGLAAKEALGRLHWDRYYGDFIVQRDPIPRPNRRY